MNLEGLTEKRNRLGTIFYEDIHGNCVAKICKSCCVVKELTLFASNKKGLGGKKPQCKECDSCEYQEKRELVLERSRRYYQENKESRLQAIRNYREENKETVLAASKNWKEKNKEQVRLINQMWYERNKEEKLDKTKKWARENKDKMNASGKRYRQKNKEKISLKTQRRRARKSKLPDTLTYEQYSRTLSYFGNTCALTGETENLEKEHAIPLSIGHGGTTFENCYPMVNGLNQSKSNANIFEWFEANRQRFNLSQERFDRLIEWLGKANGMTVEEYRDYVYWCHANPRNIDEDDEQQAI